ncbi:MAG: AAA family ATPase [Clostridia bacterium]
MSYLSKLVAEKFGGLNGKTLPLTNGLNIVYGPNEAGKSTWAALIKMLFYGWGAKKEEKKDYEKYCKDANFLIRAFVELYQGKQLYLERAKKETCKAIFTEDGSECKDLTGSMPGEILFGVDRETFEKTAFIGQLQLEPKKTDGIEQKLSSILRTGDSSGQVSYEDSRKVLDELSKELSGIRSTSKIKNVQLKISELTQMLEDNRALLSELNQDKMQLEESTKAFATFDKLSRAREASNAKATLTKIRHYRTLVSEKEGMLVVKQEMVTKDGFQPDFEFIAQCEQKLKNCEALSATAALIDGEQQTALEALRILMDQLQEKERFLGERVNAWKLELDTLKNTVAVQLQLKAANDTEKDELDALKRTRDGLQSKLLKEKEIAAYHYVWLFKFLSFSLILLAVEVFSTVQGNELLMFASGLMVVVTGVGFFLTLFKQKKRLNKSTETESQNEINQLEQRIHWIEDKIALFDASILPQATARIAEILALVGCATEKEFEEALHRTAGLVNELDVRKKTADTLLHRRTAKQQEVQAALDELKEFSHQYFLNYGDLPSLKGELQALKAHLMGMQADEMDIQNALASIESLLVNHTEEELSALAQHVLEGFDVGEAEQAQENARLVDVRMRALRESIASKTARLGTKGKNLDEIEVELSHQQELLEEYLEKDAAVKLAMSMLGEAYQTFSNQYAPELAKNAQRIFAKMTNGKYDTTSMNADFEMVIADATTDKRLDAVKMSTGTLEQLWLSLRLALVEMIFESSNMQPPLVLDDALVNFDEDRCNRGLDYLLEISKNRQVILFTCHKRESEYFAGNPSVHRVFFDQGWGI